MILVVGGRSKIGSALIDDLAGKGEAVRALVRSEESKDSLPAGAEAAVGDLADPASLRAALEGVDRVFVLCGPNEDEVQLNKNAIDAAKEAGVDLLVRSSILGADPASQATFARDHGQCDAHLKDSGVPYAILRPNLFMQNIPENTIPSIGDDGNFYANAGDARISMVDTRDVAAVAAEVLTTPGHGGKEYDVTGPEALSYGDVASKVSGTLGREVTYVPADDDSVRAALAGFGLGDWLVGGLVDLFQDYRRSGTDGYAAQTTDTVERVTGASPRTLGQLLDELPAVSPT